MFVKKMGNISFEYGNNVEDRFINYCKSVLQKPIKKSSKEDNILNHVDVIITEIINKNIIYKKYDIKGVKRISRNLELQDIFHWIEIQNVNGNKGWAYASNLDGIIFETFDEWIVISPTKLIEIIDKFVIDEFVNNPQCAIYKKYRREFRNDIITLIETQKLREFSDVIYKKHL